MLFLTPRGIARKTRLTYGYKAFSLVPYRQTRETLRAAMLPVRKDGLKRVAIYGLGAHKSGPMTAYLARQHAWLTVERLPPYAPDLNPVEQVWGNVKGAELANMCAEDPGALRRPLCTGLARTRQQSRLEFAFMRHAGLAL